MTTDCTILACTLISIVFCTILAVYYNHHR